MPEEQVENVTALGNWYNVFEMLEKTADTGNEIIVNWRHHEVNEIPRDCEDEF